MHVVIVSSRYGIWKFSSRVMRFLMRVRAPGHALPLRRGMSWYVGHLRFRRSSTSKSRVYRGRGTLMHKYGDRLNFSMEGW